MGLDGKSAVIEMAQASGLHLIQDKPFANPIDASTFGTGELIRTALERGAEDILIGLGVQHLLTEVWELYRL